METSLGRRIRLPGIRLCHMLLSCRIEKTGQEVWRDVFAGNNLLSFFRR